MKIDPSNPYWECRAVTADTAKSMGVDLFTKEFPNRAFNAGIA
jgi:transketolase C-terminal domain/subunit